MSIFYFNIPSPLFFTNFLWNISVVKPLYHPLGLIKDGRSVVKKRYKSEVRRECQREDIEAYFNLMNLTSICCLML